MLRVQSRLQSHLKIWFAMSAATVGVLLPHRARVLYSEALGWVAQLVPPRFYRVPQATAGDEVDHGAS